MEVWFDAVFILVKGVLLFACGLKRKFLFLSQRIGRLQGSYPGAVGGMPPGGDPAFLIFWFFLIKQKERTKETNYCLDEDSPF